MQLAYLDPHPVPGDCPEALQILYTVDALGDLGVCVTLVTPPATKSINPQDILGRELSKNVQQRQLTASHPRWLPIKSNQPFYRAAVRTLRSLHADAVLVRNLKMAEHLLRRVPELPLFFETHELFSQSYREENPNMSFLQRRKLAALAAREGYVYRYARGLVALTPMLIEDVRKEYAVDTPAVVAPDGVDIEQARPPVESAKNDVPVLLYLGSLHPWKGVDVLIRAMEQVMCPAVLYIVGGNNLRIDELRALARKHEVSERVVLAGPVEPGQRFNWIHKADICLLPLTETSIGSRYTSPMKLFEYMAAGKPIVVADLPAIRTVLTDKVNALLVAPNSLSELSKAIVDLIENPEQRRKLGHAARARAVDFSWRNRAKIISSLIENTGVRVN